MDPWLISQMNCACGHKPCRLSCSSLPSINESTTTRCMFILFLILGILINCILLVPNVQTALIENIADLNETCSSTVDYSCFRLVGNMAIYRLCMALVIFFLLFAIFAIGIDNSRTCRAGIHNGFWLVKFILFCALCSGALIIPSTHSHTFSIVWGHLASIGAVVFAVVQLNMLINFSHSWTNNWLTKAQKKKCWYVGIVVSAMILFSLFACGVILMFANVAARSCSLNKILIGINSSLCLVSTFISVLPYVETYTGDSRAGLLQSSIVSCYILYLSWTAFQSNQTSGARVENDLNYCGNDNWPSEMNYFAISLMLLSLIYSSFRTIPQNNSCNMLAFLNTNNQSCCPDAPNLQSEDNEGGQNVIRNESQGVVYSYSLWHVVLSLAAMYLMMESTNWFRPDTLSAGDNRWITVWMKIISTWFCLAFYFYTLLSACFKQNFRKVVNLANFDTQYMEAQV